MDKKSIIDAWARIRTIDQTIPDDVLDFMKDAAIEKLQQGQLINLTDDTHLVRALSMSMRSNGSDASSVLVSSAIKMTTPYKESQSLRLKQMAHDLSNIADNL